MNSLARPATTMLACAGSSSRATDAATCCGVTAAMLARGLR
jgi:hypothetical protein